MRCNNMLSAYVHSTVHHASPAGLLSNYSMGAISDLKSTICVDAYINLPTRDYNSLNVVGSYTPAQELIYFYPNMYPSLHNSNPNTAADYTKNLHLRKFNINP